MFTYRLYRSTTIIACGFVVWLASGVVSPVIAEDLMAAAIARMGDDLRFLSSDELEGRDTGSEGIRKAAEYIADRFNSLGLETDRFDGTAFQTFSIAGPAKLGPAESNSLRFIDQATGETVEQGSPSLGESFSPLTLGRNGSFDGELVFAGYGISAAELGYDDYANIDVTGKVVIVLRKEPQQNDPNSKFDGNRNSPHALFTTKEGNAAVRQAAALLLVNDARTAETTQDQLPGLSDAGIALTDSRIPTLFCSRALVDPIVQRATGKSLLELEHAIDEDLQPRSQVLGLRAVGETSIEQTRTPVRNVVGYLPGAGNLADEYVIVGAHYDHVGMGGGRESLARGTIAVHNGADDNGSGTTTVMELARRLSLTPAADHRGIIFVLFTGEEKGLLGSQHYVRSPRWPLEQTVAMVNLDMVGRLVDNTLTVYGTGTAHNFDKLIDEANAASRFNLMKVAAGYGPSDHASFYAADIPVFHFFTGLHNDYHRPSDDFEKVNLEGMARIADMITVVVQRLATDPERPQLIKSKARAVIRGFGREESRRAVLGIELDLSSSQAKVAKVISGSPAETAGLQAGDIILRIDDQPTDTQPELRQVLAGKQPGETVQLTILRGEERLQLSLQLGEG